MSACLVKFAGRQIPLIRTTAYIPDYQVCAGKRLPRYVGNPAAPLRGRKLGSYAMLEKSQSTPCTGEGTLADEDCSRGNRLHYI